MLLAYIDETSNTRCYRTVGLVVRADDVRPFAEQLDAVVAGAPLKSMVRARISIYRQAFDVTAQHAEGIWVEGLDRKSFRDRYAGRHDEHVTTLLHLLEKLNRYANRRGEDLIVIADEHRTARSAQAALRQARRERVWGYRGKPQRIADTVYFVSSAGSRLVQAADLVAFLYQRLADGVDRNERAAAANKALWSALGNVPVHDRLWEP
ncbi:DUF3800 domain-containing protein [Promicromonospora thailandica]|uniref:DUF3800 domain-containing protein n=1 Tax=Promicromonospora thailandica TaxID=765201 RepID=A0A9X2G1L5_9MICO|nr:DUF3800 domain-containing protein [Promicromonospora thailandica]MCP2264215.1 Protein of unknown function (DUF3800) [Promicromonospora thailandica]BFF21113.1 hypothetical protein GCM10025730_46340 [Promicromonospora thailandica]